MHLHKHSDTILKAVPSAPVAMAASCWSFRANSSAKFPETQALLSGWANMLCPGTNLGVHVERLRKCQSMILRLENKHSKEGTRIWPWWVKGHDTTTICQVALLPLHASWMVPLSPRRDFASSGVLSSKLRPFGGHLFNLVTPICHNTSGRISQVKWFILITCNYYTLLTVSLKVEILPSVGTKIHEASPWHSQSQAPRRRERRHRSFCRSTAPQKTSNMGTVQEMVKSAKTTGNLPVFEVWTIHFPSDIIGDFLQITSLPNIEPSNGWLEWALELMTYSILLVSMQTGSNMIKLGIIGHG